MPKIKTKDTKPSEEVEREEEEPEEEDEEPEEEDEEEESEEEDEEEDTHGPEGGAFKRPAAATAEAEAETQSMGKGRGKRKPKAVAKPKAAATSKAVAKHREASQAVSDFDYVLETECGGESPGQSRPQEPGPCQGRRAAQPAVTPSPPVFIDFFDNEK